MRDRASWSPGTWRAPGRTAAGRTFGRLGGLLGRLHLLPVDDVRRPDDQAAAPAATSPPAEAGIT